MNNYFIAFVYGAVQGITEFLPISSSGHLVILHKYLAFPLQNDLTFDLALHLATVIAVAIYFYKDIWALLIGWFKSLSGKADDNGRLSWLIIIATIPAALAGWLLEGFIENQLRSTLVVAFMLVVVGALFIIAEKVFKKADDLNMLNWEKSIVIGCAQALALIPGTSRSGITIIAGLWAGLKREAAVKFSFLLLIPITLGAFIKKAPGGLANAGGNEWAFVSVAFLSALIFGIIAIKYLISFSKKYSLNIFAYYRFALAILVIALALL